MTTLPTLHGDRVRLRQLGEADIDALFAIFSDEEVIRFTAFREMNQLSDARALLDEIDECRRAGTLLQWGIVRNADGHLVGTVTLAGIDRDHARAELGAVLGKAYWGRGYAGEGARLCLRYGFEVLELHRVEADVDPRNEPSIRLVTALGFVREGLLRDRWRGAGEWQDSLMYGLLRHEWTAENGRGGSEGGGSEVEPSGGER